MIAKNIKLSVKNKSTLIYLLPLYAYHLITVFVSYYINYFYTDILLIGTNYLSNVTFITKTFDAVNDEIAGFILDNNYFRNNTYKKLVAILSIPFVVFSALLFYNIEGNLIIKLTIITIVYCVWDTIVSFHSLAYYADLCKVSKDNIDRARLMSYRVITYTLALLFITYFGLDFINFFGKNNKANGYFFTMIIFLVIGIPLQILGYRKINIKINRVPSDIEEKEKNESQQTQNNSLSKTKILMLIAELKVIFTDKYIVILYMLTFLIYLSQAARSISQIHYIKYVIGDIKYIKYFFTIGAIIPLLMQFTFKKILKKFNINKISTFSYFGGAVSVFMIYLSDNNLNQVLFFNALYSAFSAIFANFIVVAIAKRIDYLKEVYGIDYTSRVFANNSFVAKISSAVGGFICYSLLSSVDYKPNVEQTQKVLSVLKFNYSFITFIALILAFFISIYFVIDDYSVLKNVNIGDNSIKC